MLITTSYRPSDEIVDKAQRCAVQLGGKWVERRESSLRRLRERHKESGILLFTEKEMRYYANESSKPLFFHPSTAAIRMKRLLNGEEDPLISLACIQDGDTVLDCTAGLASDAIVFAHAVGETGNVIALESNLLLVTLLRDGLDQYESKLEQLNQVLKRITIVHTEYLTFLQKQPSDSVDLVYFDPMFRKPIVVSDAISPLRYVANHSALNAEAVHEAKRVSRKKVIFKDQKDSQEFARLHFTKIYRSHNNVAYGVLE